MKSFITFLAIIIGMVEYGHAQSLIIDHHAITAFDSIPESYKNDAAALRMLFMDRSVGYNISQYLDCLSHEHVDAPNYCKRYEHQEDIYDVDPIEVHWNDSWDRSQWRYDAWPEGCSEDVNCFIDYMQIRIDSFDVFGCQFSYLAVQDGSGIADPQTGFFGNPANQNSAATYQAFADDHPDKRIIWWTTSLARGIGTPESASFNDQMRVYASTHDIILFDVADILSHDPWGNPCYDNRDGIAYKDENHPDDGMSIPAICPYYTTETDGGHLGSISAGGVRVAKAFWVLMARIAGWDGITTAVQHDPSPALIVFPNPAQQVLHISLSPAIFHTKNHIRILDLHGVTHIDVKLSESTMQSIDLSSLQAGMYIVHYSIGNTAGVQKLIVH